MASGLFDAVVPELRGADLLTDAPGINDRHLLERFVESGEEAAFEALLRRHGPMVLAVCQRVLHHGHDAEDAFQATFLVLIRKAASIRNRETLGAWLHGVAYRIAVRAKVMIARRRRKEMQRGELPPPARKESSLADLEPILDREVSRLPSKYRLPLVLCDLQGRSRKEVAHQLGLPEGTLSSRLARARELLRNRLTRTGVNLGTGSLAAMLAECSAGASVSPSLAAAALSAAGPSAATGALSVQAVSFAEGMLKGLLLAKLKIGAAVLLGVAVVGTGVGACRVIVDQEEVSAMPSMSALAMNLPANDPQRENLPPPPADENFEADTDDEDLWPDVPEVQPPPPQPPAPVIAPPRHNQARGKSAPASCRPLIRRR